MRGPDLDDTRIRSTKIQDRTASVGCYPLRCLDMMIFRSSWASSRSSLSWRPWYGGETAARKFGTLSDNASETISSYEEDAFSNRMRGYIHHLQKIQPQ